MWWLGDGGSTGIVGLRVWVKRGMGRVLGCIGYMRFKKGKRRLWLALDVRRVGLLSRGRGARYKRDGRQELIGEEAEPADLDLLDGIEDKTGLVDLRLRVVESARGLRGDDQVTSCGPVALAGEKNC